MLAGFPPSTFKSQSEQMTSVRAGTLSRTPDQKIDS